MSLVLGVDVGSQSIKAVIVDEGGEVVSSGSAPMTMTHEHDGWADQDPHAYRSALRDAVRAAVQGVQADRIVAMGLGSQVDGVVACDAAATPLRPAIIWLDKRATKQCDQLVTAVGAESACRSHRTGRRRVAQRAEDDVDPGQRTAGLAARGRACPGGIVCAALSFGLPRPGCRQRVVDDGVRRRRRAISTPNCVKPQASTRRCCPLCGPPRTWSAHCGPTWLPNSGCPPPARWSSARATSTPHPSGRAPSRPGSSSTSPEPRSR